MAQPKANIVRAAPGVWHVVLNGRRIGRIESNGDRWDWYAGHHSGAARTRKGAVLAVEGAAS